MSSGRNIMCERTLTSRLVNYVGQLELKMGKILSRFSLTFDSNLKAIESSSIQVTKTKREVKRDISCSISQPDQAKISIKKTTDYNNTSVQ